MSFKMPVILIVGLVVVTNLKADSFANFYDDSSCTLFSSIGVDINNDGCLEEPDRGSVHIPDTGRDTQQTNRYCLVITTNSGECNCQNVGYDFTATGFCKTLDPNDQSYRFIHQSCGGDNC